MKVSEFESKMNLIVSALKERGYDPYIQLLGYVTEKQPNYITSHNNARSTIQMLDFDMVKQYVEDMKKGV